MHFASVPSGVHRFIGADGHLAASRYRNHPNSLWALVFCPYLRTIRAVGMTKALTLISGEKPRSLPEADASMAITRATCSTSSTFQVAPACTT